MYRFEIAVCDKNKDVVTFVIFDSDGVKLAGRRAPEILNDSNEV